MAEAIINQIHYIILKQYDNKDERLLLSHPESFAGADIPSVLRRSAVLCHVYGTFNRLKLPRYTSALIAFLPRLPRQHLPPPPAFRGTIAHAPARPITLPLPPSTKNLYVNVPAAAAAIRR